MKRITLILSLICISLASVAQDHLTFKGIPITGTMSSFCQKLQQKGLRPLGSDKTIRIFKGDFTGREATIGVVAAQNGKDVFGVAVMFPESKEWNRLTNTYDYFKELYTEKYGRPSFQKERNPSHSDSNTAKMAEVHQGTVTWTSTWDVTGGEIELSIDKTDGFYEGMVVIRYKDSRNVRQKRQSDLDEI